MLFETLQLSVLVLQHRRQSSTKSSVERAKAFGLIFIHIHDFLEFAALISIWLQASVREVGSSAKPDLELAKAKITLTPFIFKFKDQTKATLEGAGWRVARKK